MSTETTRGEASERAVEAFARRRFYNEMTVSGRETGRWDRVSEDIRDSWLRGGAEELAAAHDPALGEDRSVRLGGVLDALRAEAERVGMGAPMTAAGYTAAAELIARAFSSDPEGGENA